MRGLRGSVELAFNFFFFEQPYFNSVYHRKIINMDSKLFLISTGLVYIIDIHVMSYEWRVSKMNFISKSVRLLNSLKIIRKCVSRTLFSLFIFYICLFILSDRLFDVYDTNYNIRFRWKLFDLLLSKYYVIWISVLIIFGWKYVYFSYVFLCDVFALTARK